MSKINIRETAWKFLKPTETMCVILGVFTLLALVAGISMYRDETAFNATLSYEKMSPTQKKRAETLALNIPTGDFDKNVRYSERIREASAIGLGASLFLVSERVSRNRVLTLIELMRDFSKSDLLPPGTEVLLPTTPASFGLLKTTRGFYYLHYSPAPLKVEILAASFNGLADGAEFILRVPDTSAANLKPEVSSIKVTSAGAWATIFEAPETDNHYIPPPFSPAAAYLAMEWKIRPLQQSEMSAERVAQLNEYLQKQN